MEKSPLLENTPIETRTANTIVAPVAHAGTETIGPHNDGLAQVALAPSQRSSLLKQPANGGRLLNALQEALLDTLLIFGSFILAWWTRYELQVIRQVDEVNYTNLTDFLGYFCILTACILLIFKIEGLYDLARSARWLDEVGMIVQGSLVGVAGSIVFVFYFRELTYSRLMFLYSLVFLIVLLALSRLLIRAVRFVLRMRGKMLERLLIVGAGAQSLHVMRSVVAQPELGYRIAGFADDERRDDIGRFHHLGRTDEIEQILLNAQIDQVVIALPSASHDKILKIAALCQQLGVTFRIVPDSYELSLSRVDINELPGVPLITMHTDTIVGWNRLIKRGVDVLFAVGVLLVSAPVMALTALAVKLDSRGPIFFAQERVGENGRRFKIYKFRSMHINAEALLEKLRAQNEATGPIFKMKHDPRCTRIGRIIRKLSIDELPQFYNILRGEMSLVGPRPPLQREVDLYQSWHMRRLEAPPGLTGLWQVSGRSKLTFDEMVMLDIFYIENWSLSMDLKIILRTIPAVLFSRGAH